MNKQKKGKKEEQMRKGEVGYTVGGIEGKGGKTEKREKKLRFIDIGKDR